MKHHLLSRIRSFALATGLVAALLGAGCITRQVRQAIDEVNLASLMAEVTYGNDSPSQPNGSGWAQASAKLEEFIAAHPENKSTVAALRIRQAMMLLNNRQFNLAKAAFDEANLENLHTSRDRALKELQEELLWWFPTAGGTLPAAEYPKTSTRLAHITTVRAGLMASEDEGIRDWLAALRAWIALKMANDADENRPGVGPRKGYLEDALNTFASMLPANESERWQRKGTYPAGLRLDTITGSDRRRFFADDLIAGAKKAMVQNAITNPELSDPYFKERLVR